MDCFILWFGRVINSNVLRSAPDGDEDSEEPIW